MSSRIVALLTDFGHRDPFVGMMKGVMLAINPDLQLVDISHEVAPQCIREAAIVLAASFRYFPPQTIFLVVVDPGVGGDRRPIIVETTEHLFVGPDNGVLSPMLEQAEMPRVIHATQAKYFRQPVSRTFHGRDVFAPLAAWLSRGVEADEMGPAINDPTRLQPPQPRVQAHGVLEGEVIYQDRFGNLITNISEALVRELWGPPPWQHIQAGIEAAVVHGLDSYYAQRSPGELGMVVNSWGFFELFANGANAGQITGASAGSPVILSYGDSQPKRG